MKKLVWISNNVNLPSFISFKIKSSNLSNLWSQSTITDSETRVLGSSAFVKILRFFIAMLAASYSGFYSKSISYR